MTKAPLSTRQIINRIYQDLCGFTISTSDAKLVKQSKGSPVYGEINPAALDQLLTYLNLNPNDIFYDLGSGVGKVIIQTLLSSSVGQAIGIELSKERFYLAQTALERAENYLSGISLRGSFKNQDLLTVDLSEASVIYTCSTAFSEAFMHKLTRRLAMLSQPFRLVSLQELPNDPRFKPIKTLKLDMSWARKVAVHIYQ